MLLLTALLAPAAAAALESAPVTSPRATVTLMSETDRVMPGSPYRVALRMRMAPGWHTYWQNPGDAGVAPEMVFSLPPGVTAGPIDWPAPARQPEEGLMTYGYAGEVLLPVTISGGPGPVRVEAHWLVCDKICVPEEGVFSIAPAAGPASSGPQSALFIAADARRPRTSPWTARIAPDGVLTLEGQGISATAVADAWFMPAAPDRIAAAAKQALVVSEDRLRLAMQPGSAFRPGSNLDGVLVLRDRGGQETALAISAVPGPAETSLPLWQVLAFALIGGLVLNLMPCVFPVLAMKAVSLSRLSGKAHGRARGLAAAYAGGVIATFLVVGGILVALRQAGDETGWGFQFQSPMFVGVMVAVLFAVGLNLSGVYALGQTVGAGQSLAGRDGYIGAFCAGLLAVLVATPCTAPFMGVAITAGLASSIAVTLAVFVALGVGLAAPYVMLACIPAVARALPRPGPWMEVFRQILAFPMYGAAVWLLWVLSLESGSPGVLAAGAALVLVGFALWAIGMLQRRTRRRGAIWWVGGGASALAVAGAVIAVGSLAHLPPAEMREAGAEAFTVARLDALRAEGKPVFVNITAAWCVTCLVNEKVALAPAHQAFADSGTTYLKGDWTRPVPEITAFLRANGHDGVPLYVYYPPGRGTPVVLPQLLTPAMVLAAIATPG